MTADDKGLIVRMARSGLSYSQISRDTGIRRPTVTKICKENGVNRRVHPSVMRANQRTGKKLHEKATTYICEWCDSTYRKKRGRHPDQGNRFCSRSCAFASRKYVSFLRGLKALHFTSCVVCGNAFAKIRSQDRFCSDTCRKRWLVLYNRERNASQSDRIGKTKVCHECGNEFVLSYSDKRQRYCSKECSKRSTGRVARAVRRARIRSSTYDMIDPLIVFERDGWRCMLCGKRTPRGKRGSLDDRAPELDHIVPLSRGGLHVYQNVQCACRA